MAEKPKRPAERRSPSIAESVLKPRTPANRHVACNEDRLNSRSWGEIYGRSGLERTPQTRVSGEPQPKTSGFVLCCMTLNGWLACRVDLSASPKLPQKLGFRRVSVRSACSVAPMEPPLLSAS